MAKNRFKLLLVEDDGNIRKKLGERPGDRRYISNELGVGYRMMSDE